MSSGRARMGFSRLALVVFGALLGLVCFEVALHISGWWIGRGSVARSDHAGRVLLLAVGDSNTYGLYLREDEAYPRVLEELWAQRKSEPPLAVVNLGYPGMNSTLLADQFEQLLAELAPRVVTCMIGINDFWTVPMPGHARLGYGERLRQWLWQHVRIYRFFYFLYRRNAFAGVEVPQDLRDATPEKPPPPWNWPARARVGGLDLRLGFQLEADLSRIAGAERTATLEENLKRMVTATRRAGACMVLLTYPANGFLHGLANETTRRVARELGVALVDVARDFAPLCPVVHAGDIASARSECDEYLFADQHPNARAHREIAFRLLDPVAACVR